jgi:hypothetical protein
MTWFHYALVAGNSTLLSASRSTDEKSGGEKFIHVFYLQSPRRNA